MSRTHVGVTVLRQLIHVKMVPSVFIHRKLACLHRALGAIRWQSSYRRAPVLTATPVRALIDDRISIKGHFLPPHRPVTLCAQMHSEDGDLWQAFAHYKTNGDGALNLARDHSVGGSYLGCEPMGLFWGLQPAPGGREGLRLRKNNVETPYIVDISLLEGHVSPSEGPTTELAAVTTERWYMAPGVKRIEIRQNGVVGTLFLPPGRGRFPAVLDLWGMGGGLVEYRSALLASRGYATLSLAYFGHKDLPGPQNQINVGDAYFRSAFQLLRDHQQVCADRVGIVGLSFGVYLALRIATKSDCNPSCLVCINGPVGSTNRLRDEEGRTESFESDHTYWTYDEQGHVSFRAVSLPANLRPENIVKLENIACPLMYIMGEDDQSTSSPENANLIEETLRAAGKSHLFTSHSYPGAGHLIEPPYSPNSRTSLWSIRPQKRITVWGGDLALHAAAQENSWKKILGFIEKHLRGTLKNTIMSRTHVGVTVLRQLIHVKMVPSVFIHRKLACLHPALGAIRWQSSYRRAPVLTATPVRALIDDRISIKGHFLPPHSPLTLCAQMHSEDGDLWQAFAHYKTNGDGTLNLARDHSVEGSYLGCEPMGLFWGLQPAPGGREGLRLRKKNVETPYIVDISLLEGHLSPSEGPTTELAAVTTERWYMAPGVKRIEIRQNGVVGTLFLPPGRGRFPAVLDLWGMGGGLVEYRSALLASRGYATLSLAYFGHKDLPGPQNQINVGDAYFRSAFQLLRDHQQVCADQVGIIGLSYGVYLALRIATESGFKPSCLVCINGPIGSTIKVKDEENRTAHLDSEGLFWTYDEQGYVSFRAISLPANLHPETIAKLEKLDCPLMYILGEDDLSASSLENANLIEETLRAAGKSQLFTRLSYPGAGHLIEPPYSPNSRTSLWSMKPKKLITVWGGHLAPHAAAQEDAWRKMLDFMEEHLRG